MRSRLFVLLSLCLLSAGSLILQLKPSVTNARAGHDMRGHDSNISSVPNVRIVEAYGKLPLSFEANQGQTASDVKFLSRGGGYSLFLTSNEAVLALNQSRDRKGAVTQHESQEKLQPLATVRGSDQAPTAVLRMKLVGANPAAQVAGVDELPGKSNYFIGNDPAQWRTNVPTYAMVKYEEVYPGIDLVYYGNQRQLEYDFVVSPGADPRTIRLAFPVSNPSRDEPGSPAHSDALGWRYGATTALRPRIDPQGDLVLGTEGSELRLHRPVIYQEIHGSRQPIDGGFVIERQSSETSAKEERQVGFEVARYDASKPLIIDPVLSYSTYLGGSDNDVGQGITVDSSGNAYVTGLAFSTDFPTANAFQATHAGGTNGDDVFVTKLNASGSALVYSTYLGGTVTDEGTGIAVDSYGNAYVTGRTDSGEFPVTNASKQNGGVGGSYDAFVTKLSADGSALAYSTYLGGSGDDEGQGLAVDSSGNAYVTGFTYSTDFPTANAFQTALAGGSDAFVTKLNATGSAVYSTYLGGSGNDYGFGIAVDSSGDAFVTGRAYSTNFPTKTGAFQTAHANDGGSADAFVTKFNAAGSALFYSTYLGGGGYDVGIGIAVDTVGFAYVTGRTSSGNFPTLNAFQATNRGGENVFVTKLSAAGSALVYSTYIGGSTFDYGYGIAVDSSGNAYVTGYTTSPNFPTANAFQAAKGDTCCVDAFVTKLSVAGSSLVYSTYLGGNYADWGGGIAVDSSGNAYVTGAASSSDFPTANALQGTFGGAYDAFVTKFPPVPEQPKKRRGQLTSD